MCVGNNLVDVRERGGESDDLEVESVLRLQKKEFVEENFEEIAAVGVAQHVDFIDDHRFDFVDRFCLNQMVDDAVGLLDRANDDVFATMIPTLRVRS